MGGGITNGLANRTPKVSVCSCVLIRIQQATGKGLPAEGSMSLEFPLQPPARNERNTGLHRCMFGSCPPWRQVQGYGMSLLG